MKCAYMLKKLIIVLIFLALLNLFYLNQKHKYDNKQSIEKIDIGSKKLDGKISKNYEQAKEVLLVKQSEKISLKLEKIETTKQTLQTEQQKEEKTADTKKISRKEDDEQIDSKPVEYAFDFVRRYPQINQCSLPNYPVWKSEPNMKLIVNEKNSLYGVPAPQYIQEMRVIRGVLVYFPIDKLDNFAGEFRWMYRSWIEMIKHESPKWRTDLIVFTTYDEKIFNQTDFLFSKLNCRFDRVRVNNLQKPMCTLIQYEPIKSRKISKNDLNKNKTQQQFVNYNQEVFNYEYLLNEVDLFASTNETHEKQMDLNLFHYFVKTKLKTYGYVDSILMAFDGYEYFKKAGYNFLIRSDMDVFLTPLFGKFSSLKCNDFYTGNGAYSETMNAKRLRRASKELGFKHGDIWNLGSTWYSTPEQFRLVAYLTIFSMGYLSEEEFSPVEREGKLGVMNWPYWHYGVLLLYGQNLGLNHLIGSRQINVIKLDKLFDVPSGGLIDINTIVHIHVYHGDGMFSKFQFKAGKYDYLKNNFTSLGNSTLIKYYALKMALEGKFTSLRGLREMSLNQTKKKN